MQRFFSLRGSMLALLLVIISLNYLLLGFHTSWDFLVAPLDDAYITYQYSRQIANGQPYRYNDGDPPTTGMTSLLFGFFLSLPYRLGVPDTDIPLFAVSLGALWLTLVSWLTYRITRRLLRDDPTWPWVAALVVSLNGAVQWHCFNGMETGLFTVLTLASLDAFIAGQIRWSALWVSLASLTRPEGQILAGLLFLAYAFRRFSETHHIHWRLIHGPLLVSVLVGFVPMIVNLALTGTTSATGFLAKSWTHNVPLVWGDVFHSIFLSYRRLLFSRFMGLGKLGAWFVPPGLLVLALVGGAGVWDRQSSEVAALMGGWFLGGLLASSALMTVMWHMGRYQAPFVPVGIILAVCGLAYLLQAMAPGPAMLVRYGSLVFLLITSLLSTRTFSDIYRRAVDTVSQQQLVIAEWLRTHLPSDARIGVHDVGSLRYHGERPTYDLIGLTTPDAAIPWRHGAGSVYEQMADSPIRPDYFAIYPDVFSIPYLAATDLFAEERFRVSMSNHAVASAGPVQGVWRADWSRVGQELYMYQPDTQTLTHDMDRVDTLDFADLKDEAAHELRWWEADQRPGFPTEVQQFNYRVLPDVEVIDGGRLISGGVTFEVATYPDLPLWLILRLHAQESGRVLVWVDEVNVGSWAYPAVPGQWLETVMRVPRDHIVASHTEITFEVVPAFNRDEVAFFAPYHLWAFQGEASLTDLAVGHPVSVTFGEDLRLLGFDLSEGPRQSGGELSLVLYWLTEMETRIDAKAFVHLYNSNGDLVSQIDGRPYYGTRPPYTWRIGEPVIDPRVLPLPGDLPEGTYTVEVGLYDPQHPEIRMPARAQGLLQSENRVSIAEIRVVE